MGIFSFPRKRKQIQNSWTNISHNIGYSNSNTGVRVTVPTSVKLPVFFSAASYIAEVISSLPWGVFVEDKDGNKQSITTNRAYRLLNIAPNKNLIPMKFKEQILLWALIYGNGYAQIERDVAGRPLALHPIHPSRIAETTVYSNGNIEYTVSSDDIITGNNKEVQVKVNDKDMFHIYGIGPNQYMGWSVVEHIAKDTLGLSLAMQEQSALFFKNGTNASGVLTHPERLSQQGIEKLRDQWSQKYTGLKQHHKPLILEEGMTWQAISISPEEAQMIESRKFQVTEVARIFKLPPHRVGDLERATFSNIEQMSRDEYNTALKPWVTRLEQEATKKLIAQRNVGNVYTKIDPLGLLKGDANSRAEYYEKMRNMGVYSANDVRRMEGLNSISEDDGGNKYVMQLNMTTLAKIGEDAEEPEDTIDDQVAEEVDTNENTDEE